MVCVPPDWETVTPCSARVPLLTTIPPPQPLFVTRELPKVWMVTGAPPLMVRFFRVLVVPLALKLNTPKAEGLVLVMPEASRPGTGTEIE